MSKYNRLEQEDIDELHERVSKFVDQHMRNGDNPNMHAGAYPPDCIVGRTHFTVPLYGINTMKKNKASMDLLDKHFPGADLDDELMPDGVQRVYKLNIPIMFPRSAGAAGGRSARGGRPVDGAPTIEWPLILLLTECILVGTFYYRVVNGIAF